MVQLAAAQVSDSEEPSLAQPGPAAESKQRERVEGEGGDRGKHSRQVNGKTPKVNIGLNR